MTDSKPVFVARIQAGIAGTTEQPERRKKDKPRMRQPVMKI